MSKDKIRIKKAAFTGSFSDYFNN